MNPKPMNDMFFDKINDIPDSMCLITSDLQMTIVLADSKICEALCR
jgi:hypothetical protein